MEILTASKSSLAIPIVNEELLKSRLFVHILLRVLISLRGSVSQRKMYERESLFIIWRKRSSVKDNKEHDH